jgi:hypothetical protein
MGKVNYLAKVENNLALWDLMTKEKKEVARMLEEEAEYVTIENMVVEKGLTLEKLIDYVVQKNGIIGVGLISLGEHLNNYCRDKIPKRDIDAT